MKQIKIGQNPIILKFALNVNNTLKMKSDEKAYITNTDKKKHPATVYAIYGKL